MWTFFNRLLSKEESVRNRGGTDGSDRLQNFFTSIDLPPSSSCATNLSCIGGEKEGRRQSSTRSDKLTYTSLAFLPFFYFGESVRLVVVLWINKDDVVVASSVWWSSGIPFLFWHLACYNCWWCVVASVWNFLCIRSRSSCFQLWIGETIAPSTGNWHLLQGNPAVSSICAHLYWNSSKILKSCIDYKVIQTGRSFFSFHFNQVINLGMI